MTTKERSYFLAGLTPEHRQLLTSIPRSATLGDEIAYLRLRIRHLATRSDDEPMTAAQREKDQLLVRQLALLTRMVSVQAKLGDDVGDELADIAELARQRMVKARLSRGEQS